MNDPLLFTIDVTAYELAVSLFFLGICAGLLIGWGRT